MFIYLLAVNLVAFLLFGIDKFKAKHHRWRISEAALLWLSVLGGSIGAWAGMLVWHHKTMHGKFKYGIPLILVMQVAGVIAVRQYIGYAERQAVQRAIERQLSHYPQSTMQDIYKSFYQDRFGAGHMISDTAAVREYMQYELRLAAVDDTVVWPPLSEPVGAHGNYVRVYLTCVTDDMLTAEQLLGAFVRSAEPPKQPRQSWAEEWQHIARAAQEAGVTCSDEDSRLLMQAAQDNRAVHHSKAYSKAYRPHYRIVRKDIFDNELSSYLYKTL